MTSSLRIALERDDESWVLVCGGELDMAAAARLEEAFDLCASMRPTSLFLNGADLSFIDSSGIWALVRCARHCLDEGIDFRVAVSPQVEATLNRTGIVGRVLLTTSNSSG